MAKLPNGPLSPLELWGGPLVMGSLPVAARTPSLDLYPPLEHPYLAVEPAGEAVWAKTGQVEGGGVVAPAGAAPGSDVVEAAVQGPLEAAGGGGRPGVGVPQSGAGEDKEWLRGPSLCSRKALLVQPTPSSQRYWVRTCNSLLLYSHASPVVG